jgi:hypothetical protein
MPSQKTDASQLDYRYSAECPACSEEAGWTGETEFHKDGTLGLRLACPHCFNQFVRFGTRYNKEFAAVPKPAFTPGRYVPVRFIRQ